MGFDQFNHARRIDADNLDIMHSDMTRLMRMDKATANVMRWEGGGGVTGDKLRIAANIIDAFPIVELWGNGKINLNPPANHNVQLSTSGTGRLQYGTYTAAAATDSTGYIEMDDAGGTPRRLMVQAP